MLGLGETEEEVIEAMQDALAAGVDVLTLGQYLRPTEKHLQVVEYVSPEKFAKYAKIGEEMGFGCDNPMDPTNLYKIDCDTVESDDACYSECQNSNNRHAPRRRVPGRRLGPRRGDLRPLA